ncbi:MAG: transporter [Deltaproteobacteria bacterium]|nr:MAG: transporter [Deltaproteobacteria bacterium]
MKRHPFLVPLLVAILSTLAAVPLSAEMQEAKQARTVRLEEAIQEALDNNHRRPASRFAVAMAEARHRQALAAYWPQLSAHGGWQHLDEPPNFIVPTASYTIPAQSIPLPPGTSITLNTPAGPQPATRLAVPEQQITTPHQDLILRDEDSILASLQAQWLLYDGGRRKGYYEQARANLDTMRQKARRTDLEIIDSVKRYYYGAVLARQLHQVGVDTLARMEVTLNITENMYKEGSGQVKKTDWLGTKVMVESLRSMVALLEKNEGMAQAALASVMGLPWNASVRPMDDAIPLEPFVVPLEDLVSATYQFSPDWARIEAGIRAAKGAVRTAKSGHLPKVALTGELHKWWNNGNTGSATDTNKEGWSVGVGVDIPLFDGFLTSARLSESRARMARLKEQKILLKEGLGLQVRDIFLSMAAAAKAQRATRAAMEASIDNRDLNTRAYQHGLVQTEDVTQAQLVESFMSAQYYKTRFDHIALLSQLDLTVGTAVLDVLGGK